LGRASIHPRAEQKRREKGEGENIGPDRLPQRKKIKGGDAALFPITSVERISLNKARKGDENPVSTRVIEKEKERDGKRLWQLSCKKKKGS